MTEANRATVLPVYFLADESASMESVVGDLNDGLRELLDAMSTEAMAAAKVRLTILGFSNDARCYLELADMREVTSMPELTADGGTSYVAAFDELYNRLDDDVEHLHGQGFSVHRPAVFFLTDGAPTDPDGAWRASLARLHDKNFKRHPNMIAFGIGNAVPGIIRDVASQPDMAYVSAAGAQVGEAVAHFMTALVQSIVHSANAAAAGETSLQIDEPKGFTMVLDSV
jgi:uncharacterized protein YegL